jgi:hypothetical protein
VNRKCGCPATCRGRASGFQLAFLRSGSSSRCRFPVVSNSSVSAHCRWLILGARATWQASHCSRVSGWPGASPSSWSSAGAVVGHHPLSQQIGGHPSSRWLVTGVVTVRDRPLSTSTARLWPYACRRARGADETKTTRRSPWVTGRPPPRPTAPRNGPERPAHVRQGLNPPTAYGSSWRALALAKARHDAHPTPPATTSGVQDVPLT